MNPTMPTEVRSTLKLQQAAVALQFATQGGIPDDVKNCPAETEYCVHCHSYEKDLLSHAFRNPPPVRTYCLSRTGRPHSPSDASALEALLHLPVRLRFHTEGETLERHRLGIDVLPVSLSFSRHDFLQSDRSIHNLVVHIDKRKTEAYFGEYELLCLSKLWCARDESEAWLIENDDEGVWFEIAGERLRLNEVATRYLNVRAAQLIGGCLQIAFDASGEASFRCADGEGADGVTPHELIAALNAIQKDDAPPPAPHLRPALNAVGCLLQNILDLENVDLNELDDMLEGIHTSRSAVTAIHRNTLFALTIDDRLFDDIADTLGMSPYLLLPQAVLLHNETILSEAHALLRHVDRVADALNDPAQREGVRRRLVDALRADILDDLPGSPDRLIRLVVDRLWKRHLARAGGSSGVSHHVDGFIAELDLAIVEGLQAHARARVSTLIDRDMLGNIFQYVSERWIFEEGHRDRGLDSLLGVLRKRAHDLDTARDAAEARQSEWRNSNFAVIGLVFTLYTVIPFEGAIKLVPGAANNGDLNLFGVGILVAAGAALVSTLLWRRVVALVYMRALGHVARKLGPERLLHTE